MSHKNMLILLYLALSSISTKGQDTITMASCLELVSEIVSEMQSELDEGEEVQ